MCVETGSGRKDGDGALAGSDESSCERVKDGKAKKRKPIREESFPAELVFQRNDFSYIDAIVDPNRAHRAGPKGYPPERDVHGPPPDVPQGDQERPRPGTLPEEQS